MSYNNIGLATPRGSGTSGHIQANRSSIRSRQQPREAAPDFKGSFAHRAPDQGILEHERKRKVEAQCFELQVQLEDDGVAQDEIDAQVDALRQRLLAAAPSPAGAQGGAIKPHERHQLAAAKQADDERMRRALGIRADHTEGAAFDRDLQQRLKEERIAERERGREERARIEQQLRADREKALAARAAAQQQAPASDRAYRDLDRGASGSSRLPYGSSAARAAPLLGLALALAEPLAPEARPLADALPLPLAVVLPAPQGRLALPLPLPFEEPQPAAPPLPLALAQPAAAPRRLALPQPQPHTEHEHEPLAVASSAAGRRRAD
ncbi:RNA-splicing factor [Rhodotorula kratochvilovae]